MDLARAKLPELSGENIQALASHLQAFCLNLGSMGKPWSCRATFSMLPPSIAEKLSKKTEKSRPWDAFGPALASFWLHFACPAVAWQSLFRLFVETRATLTEKLDLAISMPLSSGIAVCAGPGVRVGATGAEKSRPSGPKWLRRAKSSKVWTVGARCAVEVMGTAGNCSGTAATEPRLRSSQRSKSI